MDVLYGCREDILKAYRSPTNRRYYTYDQYVQFKSGAVEDGRKTVIYARVSTRNQKDDLESQVKFLLGCMVILLNLSLLYQVVEDGVCQVWTEG